MTMSATCKPLDQYPAAPRAAYRLDMITVHTDMALLKSIGRCMSVMSSVKANCTKTAATGDTKLWHWQSFDVAAGDAAARITFVQ